MRKTIAVLFVAMLACVLAGCVQQPTSTGDASGTAGHRSAAQGGEQANSDSSQPEAAADGGAAPTGASDGNATSDEADAVGGADAVQARTIEVVADGSSIVFELNDSTAAQELYDQLPLSVEVEDFSTNEKIFYLPHALDEADAPRAGGGTGTLAYYAPWGNAVMFYGEYSPNSGLYELGQAVSGAESIADLSGTIEVAAVVE